MNNKKKVLATIFAIAFFFAEPQKELRVDEDLRSQWKILSEGKFVSYDGAFANTIYLNVNMNKGLGRYLQIQSPSVFYVFLNSRLVCKGKNWMLNADSLTEIVHGRPLVSIYQPAGIDHLTTKMVYYQNVGLYDNPERPSRAFNNFILIAVTLLVIFFTALLRSNPQLTTDYLNFAKLFTFKRRDDSQFVLRITSSVNLLFYLFCSLLTSLAIIVAVHFSNEMSFTFAATFSNVSSYFALWIISTLVVAAVLMTKLLLASGTSFLFGWRDTAGFQFFNSIRGLVLALSLIGLISLLAFSLRMNIDYYLLVKCFFAMLAANAIFIFFKLLNRESTGAFHLFSYLCATEIFPLLILTKVFLF
ncbi:MAG TPA: DUF4271 domain-containing protein [Cyclobacteriaceae bacterium]|nr:DUF4271 domain-containing protein [Cyclobacteriaceae bacterium]